MGAQGGCAVWVRSVGAQRGCAVPQCADKHDYPHPTTVSPACLSSNTLTDSIYSICFQRSHRFINILVCVLQCYCLVRFLSTRQPFPERYR